MSIFDEKAVGVFCWSCTSNFIEKVTSKLSVFCSSVTKPRVREEKKECKRNEPETLHAAVACSIECVSIMILFIHEL